MLLAFLIETDIFDENFWQAWAALCQAQLSLKLPFQTKLVLVFILRLCYIDMSTKGCMLIFKQTWVCDWVGGWLGEWVEWQK